MRTEQEHWYYITNEIWQFHSFDDEPAIVVNSYETIEIVWGEEMVIETEWYKARYNNGERLRTERDNGEVFISVDNE